MKEPPKIPLKILRWFCSEERIEELEGDLYEVYQEISDDYPKSAAIRYWFMVIKSFRFYALRNSRQKNINQMTQFIILFKHNFKLIIRQLWRNKVTSAISILSLVIGLAGVLTIYGTIRYELSFNHHIPDNDRIYGLYTKFPEGYNYSISSGMAAYLKENRHPDVESCTALLLSSLNAKPTNTSGQKFSRVSSLFADTAYFDVFGQYEWLAGVSETALKDPFKVVITDDQAKKYFKYESPADIIGKQIIYGDSMKMTVSGIVVPKPENSDFIFTDIISYSTIPKTRLNQYFPSNNWQSNMSSTKMWVKLKQPIAETENEDFLAPLNNHIRSTYDKDRPNSRIVKSKPLSSLHFENELGLYDYSNRPAADMVTLQILGLISIVLLLMACFNFINLEIAQSSGKAKEVGIKKVLGSSRQAIFFKFILQCFIIALISAIIALPLAQSCLIYFKEFLPERMDENFFSPHYLMITFALLLVVSFVSGLYPALRSTSISIHAAIKSNVRLSFSEKGTPIMRKILISFQFISSQILIIGALCILFQLRFMTDKDMGFKSSNVMSLDTYWETPPENISLLYDELGKVAQITDLCRQMGSPSTPYNSIGTFKYNSDGVSREIKAYKKSGEVNYLDFYGIELLAGRKVLPSIDANEIIINETFLKEMGIKLPEDGLGKKLDKLTIVGVMKDFHMMSVKTKIKPVFFLYNNSSSNQIAFTTTPENTKAVINTVTDLYRNIFPKQALKVEFLEDNIKNYYESEKKTAKLAVTATILSILIAGLGLFGLISITIIQRTKEVGIRKILGAGIWSLIQLISKEFLILILIAFIVSVPIINVLIGDWLAKFAYKAPIGWWVYLLGGIITIMMAAIATGIKIYHAIVSNPVESLRYE